MTPALTTAAVTLRAQVLELQRQADDFEERTASLAGRLEESIHQFAVEVKRARHDLRNLKVPIGVLLSELDRLCPVPPVATLSSEAATPAPKTGRA
jgi:esterase/lipase